jgi:ribosomal protein L32
MLNRIVPADLRQNLNRPRGIIAVGALLVVLSLLANSAGLAIFIAALVVPTAVLIDLSKRDLFDVEPWWAPLTMGAAGAAAGLFITLLNTLLLKQFEDETDPFTRCCGVFLGRVNLDVPSAGAVSVIAVGLVLPVLAEVLKAAGPLYLKQQPRFSNEVMDGVTLGAAAGGGYAVATAILYFWPLVNGSPDLGGSVSGWTSALIGVIVVRSLISCATTGLICAGIWSFTLRPHPNALAIPVGSALVGTVVLAIGSLVIADQPTVVELIWNVVVLLALLAASRYVLTRAIGQDRQAVEPTRQRLPATVIATSERVICPTCGNPTRPGTFCANCGSPLPQPTPPTTPDVIDLEPAVPDDATVPIGTTAAPVEPSE